MVTNSLSNTYNIDALNKAGILSCPKCHGPAKVEDEQVRCGGCDATYPVEQGIPVFGTRSDYWCNVPREEMRGLVEESQRSGDWEAAAEKLVPAYLDHMKPLYRGDAQYLWPLNGSSRVLDVGSMWGGVALSVARHCGELVALDKTFETLNFLRVRAAQMGLHNVRAVHSHATTLPFSEGSFDLVILNGVLEWIPYEPDWIFEAHWEGKWESAPGYTRTPDETQLEALRQILRVLKPDGVLYIAIENRYGLPYFYGFPDDHINVKLVPLLPRKLGDMLSRLRGKGEYRTYVYSPRQLEGLAKKAGFQRVQLYGTHPHYIKIKKAYPIEMAGKFLRETTMPMVHALPIALNHFITPLLPKSIAPLTPPSVLALCGKGPDPEALTPRILRMLKEAGVIDEPQNYWAVLAVNRLEDDVPLNCIVYDTDKKPRFFCKISRDASLSGLADEARNLRALKDTLGDKETSGFRLPEILHYGEHEGIKLLVLSYLSGSGPDFFAHYIYNKGFNKLGLHQAFFRTPLERIEEGIFLRKLDRYMYRAIDTLVAFQSATPQGTMSQGETPQGETPQGETPQGETTVAEFAGKLVQEYKGKYPSMPEDISDLLTGLTEGLADKENVPVRHCAVHGDYDLCNLLFSEGANPVIVDFEHTEQTGLPFFDMANLVFSPLMLKWKESFTGGSFRSYLSVLGGQAYVEKWLTYFCLKAGLPEWVVPLIPKFAALEQNLIEYPPYRDPYAYPMYGQESMRELLALSVTPRS